jgi:hypothetical protein
MAHPLFRIEDEHEGGSPLSWTAASIPQSLDSEDDCAVPLETDVLSFLCSVCAFSRLFLIVIPFS